MSNNDAPITLQYLKQDSAWHDALRIGSGALPLSGDIGYLSIEEMDKIDSLFRTVEENTTGRLYYDLDGRQMFWLWLLCCQLRVKNVISVIMVLNFWVSNRTRF